MSEAERKSVNDEEDQDTKGKPNGDPHEGKAREGGWRPKEEWDGDESDWVTAKEFNFRGELMGRINEQSSILSNFKGQIAERDQALVDLKANQDKIADREFKKALKVLKQQKAEAVDEADGARVVELDEEIDNLKDEQRTATAEVPATTPDTPQEVTDWLQNPRNSWYINDPVLKRVADAHANTILNQNPNIDPSVLLKRMEKLVRDELPLRFKGGNSVDEGGNDTGEGRRNNNGNGKKPTIHDLDEDQQACARRFAKLGVMTVDQYIDDLVADGEL